MPQADPLLDEALLALVRTREKADQAREALGDRPEGRALRALHAVWRGDLATARAVELGDEPVCRAARAALDLAEGEIEGAMAEIERALDEAPDDPIVLRCAAPLLLLVDADRSLTLARRATALRPHDPGATAMLISPLLALGEDAEVEALAERPPAVFANTAGHLALRAALAQERGDLARAEALSREAIAQAPDSAGAWMQLATILRGQDRREEAEAAARYALEANPRSHQALGLLASIARKRGDEAEARRLEAEAKALNPAAELMRPLDDVRRLLKAGRHDEMLAALDRLGNLPPLARRAAAKMRLAVLARAGGTAELRRALEEFPGNDSTTLLARAELWMREGRHGEARALLEPAWAEGRPSALAEYLLKALRHDDPEAARAFMRDLIARPPGSLKGCLGIVVALAGSKMETEYLAFLEAATRQFPSSRSLLRLRIRADMAYLRLVKAWHACEDLDPKERAALRREIFAFALGKVVKLRWRQATARREKR